MNGASNRQETSSGAIVTRCTPASGAWTILRIFLPAAPLSGYLSPEYTTFKLFGKASCPLCADLFHSQPQFRPPHNPTRQHPATTGGGNTNRSMRSRIAANNLRVTATSASLNVTYFACRHDLWGQFQFSSPIDCRLEKTRLSRCRHCCLSSPDE